MSTFRNGEPIPEAKSIDEWTKADKNKQPAWCLIGQTDIIYGESTSKTLSKLYNWYAVNDSRGLAPKGYHIPSDSEWSKLILFLGGENKAGFKMKSKTGWQKNNKQSGNGNNSSGFNALVGGYRFEDGNFLVSGEDVYWWSSSEHTHSAGMLRLNYDYDWSTLTTSMKGVGMSVRCIRD